MAGPHRRQGAGGGSSALKLRAPSSDEGCPQCTATPPHGIGWVRGRPTWICLTKARHQPKHCFPRRSPQTHRRSVSVCFARRVGACRSGLRPLGSISSKLVAGHPRKSPRENGRVNVKTCARLLSSRWHAPGQFPALEWSGQTPSGLPTSPVSGAGRGVGNLADRGSGGRRSSHLPSRRSPVLSRRVLVRVVH